MVMVLGPAAGAFITNGVAIRPKVSVRAATPLAVLDPLPPEAFYIPAQQATSSGGGLDVVSLVAVLSIAYLAVSLMGPAEDTIASEKKPVQPKKSNFGWLNADMRVPPPKYEQLSDACHLIGADGRNQLFLCSAQSKDGFISCEISDDFTKFYGRDVFVCIGGKDPRSKDTDVVT